jgi:hypothetical protein
MGRMDALIDGSCFEHDIETEFNQGSTGLAIVVAVMRP